MRTTYQLENIPGLSLTIGTFDGVHLGHQKLLKELTKTLSAVLTFSNHPLSVIKPDLPLKNLMTLEQKLQLFEELGIDLVIAIPFTKELASLTYEEFLLKIRHQLPFTKLILGAGAVFGHKGGGNEKHVTAMGQTVGFETLYIGKAEVDGAPVSSQRIRQALDENNLSLAKKLLGPRSFDLVINSEKGYN